MSTASSPSYSFFYDAFGRRESFDDFGIVTSYIYDSLLAVQTNSTTSPASSQNFFTSPGGDVLAYQETTGSTTNTFVPLTDVLGSAIGLVNSSGSIATSWKYEPFGVPTPSGQASKYQYLFAGMESDPTGLYHTYARYYSPRLQRFLSEDPLQFGGGDVNLFAYAGNDSVNGADPLGMYFPGVLAPGAYCMYGFFGDAGALGETPLLAGAAAFGGSFNGFEGGRGGFAFEIAAQSALVNTATGSISVGALGGMTGAGVGPLSIQTRQSGSLGVVGVSQSQVPYSQEIAFRAPVPNVPEDFSQSPGEGWEKRGPNWWHEPSGNSLHPDPNHSPPEGPHYDWHQRGKGHQTIQLRRLGDLLQFFDAEVLDWFPIELLPME